MENVGSKMTMAPVYLTAWTCYCERIPKYLLNTELKYANANLMATLFLFVFLLFSMTTLLQLGVYRIDLAIIYLKRE